MAATSTTVVPATPKRSKAFRLPNWVYWLLLALLAVAFLGGMTMIFGRVSGEEFSPHDFKRRTFSYYEIPVVGLQVWPVKRFDATGDVETELVAKKIIVPTTPKEPRWDLVAGYRGTAQVADGDARILCHYLDRPDDQGSRTWLKWTTDKPKLAKVLWPWIAKLAEQELYLFMPDVFELAMGATESDEGVKAFEQSLSDLLASKYHDFAVVQQKLEQHAAAVELLTEAIKLAPNETTWQLELETSRKAVAADSSAEKP